VASCSEISDSSIVQLGSVSESDSTAITLIDADHSEYKSSESEDGAIVIVADDPTTALALVASITIVVQTSSESKVNEANEAVISGSAAGSAAVITISKVWALTGISDEQIMRGYETYPVSISRDARSSFTSKEAS